MARDPFLLHLDKAGVVLLDGALGTELYSRGFFLNRCYDELNLIGEGVVREVHEAYVKAGAQVLTTNTFGATRRKLRDHGVDDKLEEINRRGAEIARAAAGDELYVAGSVGPLGLRIEPFGPTSVDEAREMFAEAMRGLVAGGIDVFMLETFSDLSEIQQAIAAAREVAPHLPVIASMTVGDDGNSLYGTTPEVFTRRLDEWGADIVGVNCSVGPAPMIGSLEQMLPVTKKPVCVQPNAGNPRQHEGRTLYLASAEYMGEYAKRFVQTGARLVGGCCGTTPEHIRAMRNAIRMQVPGTRAIELVRSSPEIELPEEVVEPAMGAKSLLGERLAAGQFPVSVELTPPRGWQPEKILRSARKLYEAGIECINVPDGPRASCRMSNQALCLLIHQQVGIQVLPHYCCRDRNLLGMMSDILGLAAMGLHNILVVTGDPPKMGDYPDATAVFDVDSIGLTNMVKLFNRGLDLGGNPIKPATRFLIGVGCNPGAIDLEHEIRRFKWKVEAGAEFAITQPVFDTDKLRRFVDLLDDEHRVPIMAGIWPLASLRNAEFMNSEVPGAEVPESIMERMAEAQKQGKEAARAEGIAVAREAIREIYGVIDGVQVSAPFGRIGYAFDVLEALEDLPVKRAVPIKRPPKKAKRKADAQAG